MIMILYHEANACGAKSCMSDTIEKDKRIQF